jgi:hypothetical protein
VDISKESLKANKKKRLGDDTGQYSIHFDKELHRLQTLIGMFRCQSNASHLTGYLPVRQKQD